MSDSGLRDEERSIRIEKDAISSAIISGDGNKVVIYQYQLEHQLKVEKVSTTAQIGFNPYKGLQAFLEVDASHYFGREEQIAKLWQRFRTSHESTLETESPLRLLPILGPSGCGKSSLARAGLIPELARRPLPSKSQARVAVLVPGTHPIEALATVLARVATNDPIPVAKTREFTLELKQTSSLTNDTIIYDGLRRIANVLPEIAVSPLVVLVDQFEEVYSLCDDLIERQIFIENLIHAAQDRSGHVSVIITLRSDFLGETQRHPLLNQAIAFLGVIIPAMSKEELRRAITLPAELAGHKLDEAVVNLLVNDTLGREGALPLLQFALTRIWEELKNGVKAATTYEQIGGVGGALADEAQRIYENLNEKDKKIAQRVFLGSVQLGEGTNDTRRRANIDSLVSYLDEPESVKKVIDRFAQPGVRLMTLSSVDGIEAVEVTHEALFAHWGLLRQWLDGSRSDIRFQRRLDEAARIWDENGRPEGNLWRTPDLDLFRKFSEHNSDKMTPLLKEFFDASVDAEEEKKQNAIKAEKERKRQRQVLTGVLSIGLVLTTTAAGIAAKEWQSTELGRIEQTAIAAKNLLSNYPLQGMVSVISAVGQRRNPLLNFSNQSFPQSILDSLFNAVEMSREKNRIDSEQGPVYSIAISTDGKTIVSGGRDGTVRLWSRNDQPVGQPFQGHQGYVRSVAISTDGKTIVSGGTNGTVRLWSRNGQPVGQPFQGHQGTVCSVAISTDGKTIVSGGYDGTVRLWSRNGQPVGQPFKDHQGYVRFKDHQGTVCSVVISTDGQTIVSGSVDGTARLWSRNGQPVGQPFKGDQGYVRSVAISTDGKTIVSGGSDGTVQLWSRNGQPMGQPFKGHQGTVFSVAISTDRQTIVSGGEDGTVRLWSRNGQPVGQPFKGHQGYVLSVAISTDQQTIFSGGDDGTIRLWSRNGQPVGQPFKGHQGTVFSVAISTNRQTIVSGGRDGTVRLWSHNGQPVGQPFKGHQGYVRSVAISIDGQTIVSGGDDDTVRLWNRNGQPVGQPLKVHQGYVRFKDHQGTVDSVAISTDGQTIVSGGNGPVRLWSRNGQPVGQPFKSHQFIVDSVAISTDGQTIVSGGEDGTVRLWSRNGQPVGQPFKGHQGYVLSVAISTDGQTIVSGGTDGTIRLWSRNGQPVGQPFKSHQVYVDSVAISTDRQTIVSGGTDGTVRLWSRNGQPVGQPFKGHQGGVDSVAISTDGQTIVSGGRDGTVRLWDIKLDTWLKAACEQLRDHPVFKKPENPEQKKAHETCLPYL